MTASIPVEVANAKPMYLLEVQGLRTFAALSVAIYHVWLQRVSGGVDVFFVVSAYFMVAALLRRDPASAYAVFTYYVATARRIVPGAVIVVVSTIVAAQFFLPRVDWAIQAEHAYSSLLFIENWQLIDDGANYLRQGLGASPFQQFWALSVQGQMFLLLPAVYGLSSLVGRYVSSNDRLVPILVFSAVFLASLYYSVALTAVDQPAAYFNTYARVWEFVAGCLLALVIGWIRIPVVAATALVMLGLVALIFLGAIINVSEQFPGIIAGIPVVAAIAIIVGSTNGGRNRLLASRAMTTAAGISFAFYLWHWPLLIFTRHQLQSESVGAYGIAILVAAAVLAFLSTTCLEEPLRRVLDPNGRTAAAIGACAALVVLALAAPLLWERSYRGHAALAAERLALYVKDPSGFTFYPGELVPDPLIARKDNPPGYNNDGCHQDLTGSDALSCEFGDVHAARTVALVGGSHSLQWLPALDAAGKRDGFKVVSITKSSCLFMAGDSKLGKSCTTWNMNVAKLLPELKPELVITIGTRAQWKDGKIVSEIVPDGYREAWKQLDGYGVKVLALRDTPRHNTDILRCVSMLHPHICGTPRDNRLMPKSPLHSYDNVIAADTTDLFCDDTTCSIADGGVLIYRDRHHITRTFALRHTDDIGNIVHGALND